ncbi:hypothetical protein DACRYDRAFT_114368 [Dacryopinax primogenitus]|uniref:Uncharacterized protein n=1 Tax=Dacryopinax primogenitus (strain DJM 731) TaxID=1858805 RepID=M5G9V5_DACPD|nr:uncharacterized protein DACRYDRAFT_114368 [Dacryopinax primogenitus]EJU05090.1 hypothetical protein DACRYDRAFT_114368 [Dacryopinax primogenitus]
MVNSTYWEECSSVSTFPTNPDITGIGNRIALYTSAIVTFLVTYNFPEDLDSYRDAVRTALVTSTSLIAAALYARYTPLGLSLVDAQIVTMFMTAVTACSWAVTKLNLGLTTRIAMRLHLILSGVFVILVYYDVDHFGGTAYQPQCGGNSEFFFVIFGRAISATNPVLRVFALLLYILMLAEFIWAGRGHFVLSVLDITSRICSREPFLGEIQALLSYVATGSKEGEQPENQRFVLPALASLLGVIIVIYLIITVEKMLSWNDLNTLTVVEQWTFGQTLAVLNLGDQIIRLGIKVIRRLRDTWRKSNKDINTDRDQVL